MNRLTCAAVWLTVAAAFFRYSIGWNGWARLILTCAAVLFVLLAIYAFLINKNAYFPPITGAVAWIGLSFFLFSINMKLHDHWIGWIAAAAAATCIPLSILTFVINRRRREFVRL